MRSTLQTMQRLLKGNNVELEREFNIRRAQLVPLMLSKLGQFKQMRPRRVRTRAGVGDELHITEAMQGRHDTAWSTTRRMHMEAPGSPRYATVSINSGMIHHEDPVNVLWRAAAASIVCDFLERSGIRVEIVVEAVVLRMMRNTPETHHMTIVAKSYDMPLATEQLAALGSAAFSRSARFALKEANSLDRALVSDTGTSDRTAVSHHVNEMRKAGNLVLRVPYDTFNLAAATRVVEEAAALLSGTAKAA